MDASAAAVLRRAEPPDVEGLVLLLGVLFGLEADFRPDAARQRRGLVARRIHPLKTQGDLPIAEAVAKLQQVLRGNPPPWLRRLVEGS